MSTTIQATTPLIAWRGEKATYHLVTITGDTAEAISTHAALHRMEFGKGRGFGSVKCYAQIGDTRWKTSVFPMRVEDMSRASKSWTLLVSKAVMRAEDLAKGQPISLSLELI